MENGHEISDQFDKTKGGPGASAIWQFSCEMATFQNRILFFHEQDLWTMIKL